MDTLPIQSNSGIVDVFLGKVVTVLIWDDMNPSDHGPEHFRYFPPWAKGLLSIRDNAVLVLYQGVWKVDQYRPTDTSVEDWIAEHRERYESWQDQCKTKEVKIPRTGARSVLYQHMEDVELNRGLKLTEADFKRVYQSVANYNAKSQKHFVVRAKGTDVYVIRTDVKRKRSK